LCNVSILKQPCKNSELPVENEFSDSIRLCFDRLGVTLYSGCEFVASAKPCKFCGWQRDSLNMEQEAF